MIKNLSLLRERTEDIQPLLHHFVCRCAQEQGKPTPAIAPQLIHDLNNVIGVIIGYGSIAMEQLADYDPLKHYIEGMTTSALQVAEVCKHSLLNRGQHCAAKCGGKPDRTGGGGNRGAA